MAQEYAPQKVVMSEALLIHINVKYSVQNAHWSLSEIMLNRPEIIFIYLKFIKNIKINCMKEKSQVLLPKPVFHECRVSINF